MNLSYWEYKTWLSNIDYTIIGSGIVGLNCALQLKKRFPKAKIVVLEKGMLPQGASTKNAGFACFGSISEIIADLKTHEEEAIFNLVKQRWEGIQILRENLGDDAIDYQNNGGHEIFMENQEDLYHESLEKIAAINTFLAPIFHQNIFKKNKNLFQFKGIKENYITSVLEAQIDTGKMMFSLLQKVLQSGVTILNSITVEGFTEAENGCTVKTNLFEFKTQKILVATNGFASQLLQEKVNPARAQILITEPIKNLHIKGTFHLEEGYYYFRNIHDRILFGGARNLDFIAEETTAFGETTIIQNQLENILKNVILPETSFKIAHRWSGIMGLGNQKKPIVKQISNHVYCGVRLGGLGIAIGSLIGKELADLV